MCGPTDIETLIEELQQSKTNLRFNRLLKVCEKYFGEGRVVGSHHVFKTPWIGDPRINLQRAKDGKAKPYQVNQVTSALARLAAEE